ncbi:MULTISPECIES: L,D-transpeptidase [Lentzea]|uniref:L,D-transpeptidase catalytic domain n=2 Tax=Lentzea TaxID=165301 RepID=A0A1W2DCN9_9PSEU|nr:MULTISPECIES: L,D-transpeptidase [Lentzea]MDX8140537.1 L,D-transpeptidase [Lentzea sp. BCCO 10_0061]SMC95211.1 L,D-transpeptidase catalytic domain [Lentzea albidocapillata]
MIHDGDQLGPAGQDDEQRPTPGPQSPSGERRYQTPPTQARRRPALLAGAGLVAVTVFAALLSIALTRPTAGEQRIDPLGQNDTTSGTLTSETTPVVAPQTVSADQLASLPQATTFATTPAAPRDPAPEQVPGGLVAHPTTAVPVYAAPGGDAVAVVPATQPLGIEPNITRTDTWLSILDTQPGWALVALPSRPNNSVAWMHIDTPDVTVAKSPSVITVDRPAFEVTLTTHGTVTGRWKAGIGKPGAITPAGRTFLLAALRDNGSTFSKVVLPLGTHSDTHLTFGGGPGTVGLHTWPTPEVYGTASSDGCVRIPPDALSSLTEAMTRGDLPLGTPVLIK